MGPFILILWHPNQSIGQSERVVYLAFSGIWEQQQQQYTRPPVIWIWAQSGIGHWDSLPSPIIIWWAPYGPRFVTINPLATHTHTYWPLSRRKISSVSSKIKPTCVGKRVGFSLLPDLKYHTASAHPPCILLCEKRDEKRITWKSFRKRKSEKENIKWSPCL